MTRLLGVDRRRVLVTGGCGFLGSHVVDELLSRGHFVLVQDDLSTAELEDDGETPRWKDLRAFYYRGSAPNLRDVEAVVHLALRHPLERERACWAAAFEGYVVQGTRLLLELLNLQAPLRRFALCGPGRGDDGAEARMVSALRALSGYWHRPPALGVYCLWTPELTGARRAVPLPEGALTASVEGAARRLADLADGTAKHRCDPDLHLEVGE